MMMNPRPKQSTKQEDVFSTWQQAMSLAHPAALKPALLMQSIFNTWAKRATTHGAASVHLVPFAADMQTWREWLEMQRAVWQRFQQEQQQWMQGWTAWLEEYAQIRRANTMSKLAEQEFNLMAQWVQLFSNQATSLVTLQENVEVNYQYWAGQRLKASTSESTPDVVVEAKPEALPAKTKPAEPKQVA